MDKKKLATFHFENNGIRSQVFIKELDLEIILNLVANLSLVRAQVMNDLFNFAIKEGLNPGVLITNYEKIRINLFKEAGLKPDGSKEEEKKNTGTYQKSNPAN